MRFLVSVVALVFAMIFAEGAHASGKITLQNNLFKGGKEYRPMLGLAIYEPFFGGSLAFNSWTGYGNQPFDLSPDVNWFTTKNQIDFYLKRMTISPGFQYSFVDPYGEERSWVYLKLDYKLW